MITKSLNGLWNVTLPGGETLSCEVPGCIERITDRWDIAVPVRYEREFDLTGTENNIRLRFGGVSYYCDVFVNGRYAGSHEGIWDGFALDITGLAVPGRNRICVEVTKPGYHCGDRFPLRQVLSGFVPDVLCTFGGIWDDVKLERAENFSGNPSGSSQIRLPRVVCGRLHAVLPHRSWRNDCDDAAASGRYGQAGINDCGESGCRLAPSE